MTPAEASDIGFTATVRAREVRFDEVPEVRVRFHGTPDHESVSTRTHLPDPVEPAVTYRDIRVDYRLAATTRYPRGEPP